MAIQGTFIADFASFHRAVTEAEVHLKGFEANSNKVESSLSKMTNAFSGTQIIQQATLMAEVFDRAGGAAGFTEQELARMGATGTEAAAKLRALGVDVPPGIQRIADAGAGVSGMFGNMTGIVTKLAGAFGIVFSVGAVVNFGKELFASTARLQELSQTTGVSTDAIQRLQFVMAEFGVDTETIARAIGTLSSRIGSGDASVAQAVKDLGLSLSDLQRMSPEDVFLAVAEAAGRLENPITKADIMSGAFGDRLARVLIPALGDLRKGMENVPTGALISDETIKSANEFDASLKRMTQSFKAAIAEGIQADVRGLSRLWTALTGGANEYTAAVEKSGFAMKTMASHTTDFQLMSSHGIKPLITDAEIMRQRLEEWRRDGMEPLNEAQKQAIALGHEKGKSDALIAETVGVSITAVRSYITTLDDQAKSQDKVKESIDRMIGSQKTYLDLILPGTSKLAELERSRAEQAGLNAKFTAEGLKTLTFLEDGLGAAQESRATGAYKLHLDEQTAIREHTEALALVEQQMKDNYVEVGNYATANTAAGAAAVASTGQAVQGYAAVAQQVTMTGEAIRAMIELSKYSAAANAIYSENKLFTTRSQLERVSQIALILPAHVNLRAGTVILHGRRKGAGTATSIRRLTTNGVQAFRLMAKTKAWGPFDRWAFRRSIHEACAAAKIHPPLRPYDLRHFFGTELYRRSGDIRAVQILMGHSTPTLTTRYTLGAVEPRVEAALRRWR